MTGVIEEVRPLEGFVLEAVFTGGEIRHYDCRALIERYPEIFLHPRIESGGYGVVWTDELDVASEEIWDNGMAVIR